MTVSAPRTLNVPVCWNSSSLSSTRVFEPIRRASSGSSQGDTGVTRASLSRARAAVSISGRVGAGAGGEMGVVI